jgi:hypothetical protein
MKYTLLAVALLCTIKNSAQSKNHLLLKRNLTSINSRYYFEGYSKEFFTLHSTNLNYLRALNATNNWLIGVGAGYRKIGINEINPLTGGDESTTASFFIPRLVIRKEEHLGRRNKGYLEAGLNFNIIINSKTIDYSGNIKSGNELINSSAFFFSLGYQCSVNDTWKVDFGIIGTMDINPSILLNGRKIKLREEALNTGISYHF